MPVFDEGAGSEMVEVDEALRRSLDLVPFLPCEPLPRMPLPLEDEVSPEARGRPGLLTRSIRSCHSSRRAVRRLTSLLFVGERLSEFALTIIFRLQLRAGSSFRRRPRCRRVN